MISKPQPFSSVFKSPSNYPHHLSQLCFYHRMHITNTRSRLFSACLILKAYGLWEPFLVILTAPLSFLSLFKQISVLSIKYATYFQMIIKLEHISSTSAIILFFFKWLAYAVHRTTFGVIPCLLSCLRQDLINFEYPEYLFQNLLGILLSLPPVSLQYH